MHQLGIALSVLMILLGLRFLYVAFMRGRRRDAGAVVVRTRPRPRVSAQQLGRGSRFIARVVRAGYRPADEDFELLEVYTVDVDGSAIAYSFPRAWTWGSSAAAAAAPVVELEHAAERLESFSARMRSWRPGRRRERS